MVNLTLVIALLWFLFQVALCSKQESNFFLACDVDQNRVLTRREVQKCSKKNPEFSNLLTVIEREGTDLITLLDLDGDDDISAEEYMKYLEKRKLRQVGKEGVFTVTTRDGETKEMSRDELQGKMNDALNGMTIKNDKMYKEDVTVGKVDEIAQKSPEMGRFLQLGKWAHSMLINHNHTTKNTTISKFKTLPKRGSESVNLGIDDDNDVSVMTFASNFTVWLLLTLEDKSAPIDDRTQLFEMKVEYNPAVYRRPFIAILGAWTIMPHQDEGKTKLIRSEVLSFPPPRFQIESMNDRIRFVVNGMISEHGFVTVSAVFVIIVSSFVGFVAYACCVHEYKETEHDKAE